MAGAYPCRHCGAGPGSRPYVARQAALGHRLVDQGREPGGGEEIMERHLARAALGVVVLLAGAPAASAVQTDKIVSPSGIAAWLVGEPAAPRETLSFAFRGGSTQDEPDKSGTAKLAADLLDEGAGDLDGKTYHERLENNAIELNFQVARDNFHGSLQTLNEHRDEAFDLLRLALSAPRFEAAAVERVRGQMLSALQRDTTSPNSLASRRWWEAAFPGHPYGRDSKGTPETVARITADDMRDYVRRAFARNELLVSIVGDIDAKADGAVVFGSTATRADRTADALEIIERETKRMAESGPTAVELSEAKSFLKGTYALSLDSSAKIAAQLTQIQIDNLGIGYIDRRGALIDAVTLDQAKKVAKRLYAGGMLVTVAGRPKGLISSGE